MSDYDRAMLRLMVGVTLVTFAFAWITDGPGRAIGWLVGTYIGAALGVGIVTAMVKVWR